MKIMMDCPGCDGRLTFSPPAMRTARTLTTTCPNCAEDYQLVDGDLRQTGSAEPRR